MYEAHEILTSKAFATLKAAYGAGQSAEVVIGGRTILVDPALEFAGMTLRGENGFVLGKHAFSSTSDLAKTVLHELYRLEILSGAGTAAVARVETNAAAAFADDAAEVLLRAFQ